MGDSDLFIALFAAIHILFVLFVGLFGWRGWKSAFPPELSEEIRKSGLRFWQLQGLPRIRQEAGGKIVRFGQKGALLFHEKGFDAHFFQGTYGWEMDVKYQGSLPGVLAVTQQNMFSDIASSFGKEDVPTGDREFDVLYAVRAKPRNLAKAVNPDIIQEIRSLGKRGTVNLSINRNRMRLALGDTMEPKTFVDRALKIAAALSRKMEDFDGILEITEETIEITDGKTESSECQICGDPMSGNVVYCRSCATPHHRDCWEFYGRCSTYACGERKHLVEKPPPRRPS